MIPINAVYRNTEGRGSTQARGRPPPDLAGYVAVSLPLSGGIVYLNLYLHVPLRAAVGGKKKVEKDVRGANKSEAGAKAEHEEEFCEAMMMPSSGWQTDQ